MTNVTASTEFKWIDSSMKVEILNKLSYPLGRRDCRKQILPAQVHFIFPSSIAFAFSSQPRTENMKDASKVSSGTTTISRDVQNLSISSIEKPRDGLREDEVNLVLHALGMLSTC